MNRRQRMLCHPLYHEDLETAATSDVDWSQLEGKTVAISGATGMIGAFLVDTLMWRRQHANQNVSVLAIGRSLDKAQERLPHFGKKGFSFSQTDISLPGARLAEQADIIMHLASTTHPKAYATHPIGTITSNIFGLHNLLEFACQRPASPARFLFASSVEVYGENRGDAERFAEGYCGYLDCNTLRAGYPEAKRCGEALCQAFAAEHNVPVYLPRLPRTYGPTLLPSDTKALSQFIGKAADGKNIVLKSKGSQTYSYLYVADVVQGILHVLTKGDVGVAYNLADTRSDASLFDLAHTLASIAGTEVAFEAPDSTEQAGYSTATKAMLDSTRAQRIGWKAQYSLEDGVKRTVRILRDIKKRA